MTPSHPSQSVRMPGRWRVALAASLCCLWAGAVVAQPVPERSASNDLQARADNAVDPPGRVGRLSDVIGQVWLLTQDTGDWVTASRNRPLTTGDRLSTDAGARAEVRIGSTTLRLDSGSELEVLRLDDDRIALQLHAGTLSARLRSRESADEFEVKTGEGRFTTLRTGRYRFDRIDEASHVTVVNGQALYEGPGSALTVYSGQRAEFWVDASNTAQYSITEPVRDGFAAWNGERDRSDDRSASARYVSPEMTGVEDLDRHGRWEESPEYGALWFPRFVPVGWAPYSTGHWTWVRPWGWTWVDDAPWGFAPFHYGRWVYYRNSWCWAPGTYVSRPVYAPALVAWIGGPRVGVSISIGGPPVGWFPLAPREIYVPHYRVSPRYVQNVNITHVPRIANVTTIINNPGAANEGRDYSNRKFPHAVTVVPSNVLTQREPVGPAAARLRDTPAVRELVDEPRRHGTLTGAPVDAPPQRVAESGTPGRPMRPRERDANDAPRTPTPGVTRAPSDGAAPDGRGREPGRDPGRDAGRDPGRMVPPPRQAPPESASPAVPPQGGQPPGVAPAQPVPPRPRVMPNPPVTPRSDVEPIPSRSRETPRNPAPAAREPQGEPPPVRRPAPEAPAPVRTPPSQAAQPPAREALPAVRVPQPEAPRMRQPAPPQRTAPPTAADRPGDRNGNDEDLRRRPRERAEPGLRQTN